MVHIFERPQFLCLSGEVCVPSELCSLQTWGLCSETAGRASNATGLFPTFSRDQEEQEQVPTY